MNGEYYIKQKQINWAKRNGIKLLGSQGEKGLPSYTETIDENLFNALTASSKEQIEAGDGGELKDNTNALAKIKALHSSSAIAVNVFQYWNEIEKVDQIAHSCELCDKSNKTSKTIKFEQKFKISDSFVNPPNIDVIIENDEKGQFKAFAIESKFTEAYYSRKHPGLSEKYLTDISVQWEDIPNLFEFAKTISPDDTTYQHLHPAQLIKHILGLKKKFKKSGFRLLYLWYDVLGEDGSLHQKEIDTFAEIVKKDGIKFSALSYQKLIINLANNYYDGNEDYFKYITDRYL